MDWDRIAEEVLGVAHQVLSELRPRIESVADDMAARLRAGHKIMICGNGGSAADAQHFAAELVNRFLRERRPYAALALSTDTSTLTSIANDYSFDEVFAKQVMGLGKPGDLLVGISTSGNSLNVRRAVAAARRTGIHTLALVGGDGGRLVEEADEVLHISISRHVPRIQEGQELIMHLLCERVEQQLEATDTEGG